MAVHYLTHYHRALRDVEKVKLGGIRGGFLRAIYWVENLGVDAVHN